MAQRDPAVAFHFSLEFQGVLPGAFREASGLGSENEVVDYKTADSKGQSLTFKVPGRLKWDNIVLKRGITDNLDLWKWRKQIEDGKVEAARKNGSVVLFNQADEEIARWNFVKAWPSKLGGPQLNAGNNEIAVEEITIVHEGVVRAK